MRKVAADEHKLVWIATSTTVSQVCVLVGISTVASEEWSMIPLTIWEQHLKPFPPCGTLTIFHGDDHAIIVRIFLCAQVVCLPLWSVCVRVTWRRWCRHSRLKVRQMEMRVVASLWIMCVLWRVSGCIYINKLNIIDTHPWLCHARRRSMTHTRGPCDTACYTDTAVTKIWRC